MWLHLILQQLSEVVVLFLFIEAEINLTIAPGYYPGSAIYQLCASGDTSSLSGPVIFLVHHFASWDSEDNNCIPSENFLISKQHITSYFQCLSWYSGQGHWLEIYYNQGLSLTVSSCAQVINLSECWLSYLYDMGYSQYHPIELL